MAPNEKDPLVTSEAGYGSGSAGEKSESSTPQPLMTRIKETLSLFWYLGFVAFGGPTAHVAILRDHLVNVHKFIDEDVFTELFALGMYGCYTCGGIICIILDRSLLFELDPYCFLSSIVCLKSTGQGLPGPSSTQLVISTASTHGGAISGVIAFAFWCLPGFTVLSLCGLYLYSFVDPSKPPIWLLGIGPAAMALIFKASFSFVQKLDKFGCGIGLVSAMNALQFLPTD